ncbi:MAG: S-methyl-5-thioribose-1-phosphate isomerase [Cyanobacteria bacterium P01_H01_bin.15]
MKSSENPIYPVRWQGGKALLIDQRRLPAEYTVVEISRSTDMAEAIRHMVVRGAPAIGVAAAYGMYLGSEEVKTDQRRELLDYLETVAATLRSTRPTAVNLFWAIGRMLSVAYETLGSVSELRAALLETAQIIQAEDLKTCQAISQHGLAVLPSTENGLTLLTHCNAGALATAGYGTALGVVRAAWSAGRLARLYADETRPRLQGARLTTWECVQEGIPVTLITDGMAAHCFWQGLIDAVVVGADRIAANGDVANKIGTYGLAICAHAHQIPFYVAASLSTIDFELTEGSQIPIEEGDSSEISLFGKSPICPDGIGFYNPAFDVTPAHLVTGIITEHGVFNPAELHQLGPDELTVSSS